MDSDRPCAEAEAVLSLSWAHISNCWIFACIYVRPAKTKIRGQSYKTFFMLNSAEHEI